MIREDPKNENVLYIGTDLGVYVSLNQGDSWISLCSNLPTAFVHDLVVHPRDDILVIGTHGCSVYVMDVGPVQEYDQRSPGRTSICLEFLPFISHSREGYYSIYPDFQNGPLIIRTLLFKDIRRNGITVQCGMEVHAINICLP